MTPNQGPRTVRTGRRRTGWKRRPTQPVRLGGPGAAIRLTGARRAKAGGREELGAACGEGVRTSSHTLLQE